ncbi:MAG: EAL domain-containing protein [Eubacteriales bacterium]
MKSFFKKRYKELLITVAAVLFILLICCAVILVEDFAVGLDAQAEDSAKLESVKFGKMLSDTVSNFAQKSQLIANGMPASMEQATDYLYNILHDGNHNTLAFFRLVKDGEVYFTTGEPFNGVENPMVLETVAENKLAVTGVFTDRNTALRVFAVYAPVPHGSEVDGVISYYYIGALEESLVSEGELDVEPVYVGACSEGGDIFYTVRDGGFGLERYNNLFLKLREFTGDKPAIDVLEKNVVQNGAHSIVIAGEKYVVCFDCADYASDMLYTVTVYKASDIYKDGYQLVSTIYSTIIVLTLVMLVLLIYVLVSNFHVLSKMDDYGTIDPVLECPTFKKYENDTDRILHSNKVTNFAVVYIKVLHYEYMQEHFGENIALDSLRFIAQVLKKSMQADESYCLVDSADFALLLHYKENDDVLKRVKNIVSFITNCPLLVVKHYNIKTSCGIYFLDREETTSPEKMLDNAISAERSSVAEQVGNIRIYDRKIHDMFLHEAEIEAKMENSLKSGEFKVFFQPKYNIGKGKIDGAEALVRWYDPENSRFRQPDEFIPLFEANGFIAQMDKYVFVEVCKYFEESVAQGYKLVPISVNVSRVTAIADNFLDFYISTKKKYGVADNFIMIEFTESFAYENYEVLKGLVEKLHRNGFRCSIDDFGAGYSSFQILKALPMDELKLDSFFLKKGTSKERDDELLRTMISLAKSIGMEVTQEGVETTDDLERLKRFGCDIIQGYIYSRPIPVTDYISFLNEEHIL